MCLECCIFFWSFFCGSAPTWRDHVDVWSDTEYHRPSHVLTNGKRGLCFSRSTPPSLAGSLLKSGVFFTAALFKRGLVTVNPTTYHLYDEDLIWMLDFVLLYASNETYINKLF